MSYQATAWAWEQQVTPVQKLILLALANFAGNEEGECWPSINTVRKMTGQSRRTVQENLRMLEKIELVVTEPQSRRNGSSRTNLYRLALEGAPDAPRGAQDMRPGGAPDAPPIEPVIGTGHLEQEYTPKPPSTFDEFWSTVWLKVGKQKAKVAWGVAIKKASPETIIAAAKVQSLTYEEEETERKYLVHPSTWLNDERWENFRREPRGTTKGKNGAYMDSEGVVWS